MRNHKAATSVNRGRSFMGPFCTAISSTFADVLQHQHSFTIQPSAAEVHQGLINGLLGTSTSILNKMSTVNSYLSCFTIGEIPHVPELDTLVLTVGDKVAGITLRINVRYAVYMSSQHSHRVWVLITQCPTVPHLGKQRICMGLTCQES